MGNISASPERRKPTNATKMFNGGLVNMLYFEVLTPLGINNGYLAGPIVAPY